MKLSLFTSHPRLPRLVVTRTVALAFALSGCVPATSYEQANSAAEVEREGHRRAVERLSAAEEELKRVRAENETLAATKAELEDQLQKEESESAQTSLDMEGVKKEREQQAELVTQLRGELARIGDHLKAYQGDKDVLHEKLQAAEAKVATLESQIVYLKSEQETSEEAQERLRGALAELSSMQEGSESEDEGAKKPREEPTDEAGPDEAAEPVDEPAPQDPVDDVPEEVLPEEDGSAGDE